jgi:asparagine synthase (glutamine-hydrolysing)
MCGIAGVFSMNGQPLQRLEPVMRVMNRLQAHRGPDGEGFWQHKNQHAGLAHVRLSIIDLDAGSQPMHDGSGNWIAYNGEIYNYIELRKELGLHNFRTHSDTEVILQAYRKWGRECVNHLRGMFAFALWDEQEQELFCARDRFGIKPFYYTITAGIFYFASEIKALMPFVTEIATDMDGLRDYLTFQFCMHGKTLFKSVNELLPGHIMQVRQGHEPRPERYWNVYYHLDFHHTEQYFQEKLHDLWQDSVKMHLRSDVPVGAYVSGGLDSSSIAAAASRGPMGQDMMGFTGKFANYGPEYDESHHARTVASENGFPLLDLDITCADFIANIEKVIYHLDYPVAGPGSFPQYMISSLAAKHRKVVLGGQGGDEIFGGYTRYLIAYFEQCIKSAIEGKTRQGSYVVTYESIIPNLTALRQYKPMLKEFWRDGLFDDMDHRYFRLINRAPHLGDEIRWEVLGDYSAFDSFKQTFHGDNVHHESYFDLMTHFDFKTLLPALLQVEDRMSMAHGLESRVPLLDHALVECAATIPSNIKFANGDMKHIFKKVIQPYLPDSIVNRKDKMGFPTPLTDWMRGEAREFVTDIFSTQQARSRSFVDNSKVASKLGQESKFGRNGWGLLSLELWQRQFHDRQSYFQSLAPSG